MPLRAVGRMGRSGIATSSLLRATQAKLSIREGASLYCEVWGVSRATRPDVFVAQTFWGKQRFACYSDLDKG